MSTWHGTFVWLGAYCKSCDVWLQAVRRSHLDDSDSDVDSDDNEEEDLTKLMMWRVKRPQAGCKRHM